METLRIEEITKLNLRKAPDIELYSLDLRFSQLWEKYFEKPKPKLEVKRGDFLGKYQLLVREMHKRKINHVETGIDDIVFKKEELGIDTPSLGSIVLDPEFISIVRDSKKSLRDQPDINILIRDEQDPKLELALTKLFGKQINKKLNFIYDMTEWDSYIPLFEKVLRPKEKIEIVRKRDDIPETGFIEVLGTMAQLDSPQGRHFSLLIRHKDKRILIDPAVHKKEIKEELDFIIVTQADKDHWEYLVEYKNIPVYTVGAIFDRLPKSEDTHLFLKPLKIDGLEIIPIKTTPAVGTPSIGLRLDVGKKKISILPEFLELGKAQKDLVKGTIWICGVGDYETEPEKEENKLSFLSLLQLAEELKPKAIYLTNLRKDILKHKEKVNTGLKIWNGKILYDGDILEEKDFEKREGWGLNKPAYRIFTFEDLKNTPNFQEGKVIVEAKFDGMRCRVEKKSKDVIIMSDPEDIKGSPIKTKRLPWQVEELEKMKEDFVGDSEIIMVDKEKNECLHRTACHPYNQPINCNPKNIKIGEMKNPRDVKVLSYDFKTKNLKYLPPLRIQKWDGDKEIFAISKTHFGNQENCRRNALKTPNWIRLGIMKGRKSSKVWVTGDHPILTDRGWEEAKNLRKGDFVFTKGEVLDIYQREIIIGSLLGDASYSDKDRGYPLLREIHSLKQKSYALWKYEHLPFHFGIYFRKHYEHKVEGRMIKSEKAIDIFTSHSPSLLEFKELGEAKKEGQPISRKYLDKLNLLGLSIWFMDDGNFYKDRRWNAWTVILSTDCWNLKAQNEFQKFFREKWNLAAHIEKRKRGSYRLRFYGESAIWLLNNLYIKIKNGKKQFLPPEIERSDKEGLIKVSLTDVYKVRRNDAESKFKLRYNLVIPETENYFAGNILVHNCNALLNGKFDPTDASKKAHIYIFDVVEYEGKDIRDWPLKERKELLSKFKDSEHVHFVKSSTNLQKDALSYIVDLEDLKQVEKAKDKIMGYAHKGGPYPKHIAEGVMVKLLNTPYEIPQDHGACKWKEKYEIDCLVVGKEEIIREGKKTGNWNYELAVGPIEKEWAEVIGRKDKKAVIEFKGKFYNWIGRSDNTKQDVAIGSILRVASEDVNSYETDDPKYPYYKAYVSVVLQPVPEKNVPDKMFVLERLAEFTPRREALVEKGIKDDIKISIEEGKIPKDIYKEYAKENEPLFREFYNDYREGDAFIQTHIRGLEPEEVEKYKKGKITLAELFEGHSIHIDDRMSFSGLKRLVQWVITDNRVQDYLKMLKGELVETAGGVKNVAKSFALVKPSAEEPGKVKKIEGIKEPSIGKEGAKILADLQIVKSSYFIAPGEVGSTAYRYAWMGLIWRGKVKSGIGRKDYHEYFYYPDDNLPERNKELVGGRYVVKAFKRPKGAGNYWQIWKCTEGFPADPVEHKDSGYYELVPAENLKAIGREHYDYGRKEPV